jgi:hypothetical protein
MTPEQFTYWLQGFMETADPKSIDEKQTQIIKDHLDLVFTKVTPDYTYTLIPKDFGTIKDYNPPVEPYPYIWNPNGTFIC